MGPAPTTVAACLLLALLLLGAMIDATVERAGSQLGAEVVSSEECLYEGCDAYDCYEKKAECGPKGYLVGFGEKYCQRFGTDGEVYNRFDAVGKAFINCTKTCLVEDLGDYFKVHTKGIDCTGLANDAFESHSRCYLDCGFCTMCKNNKRALFNAYDLSDFLSIRALRQVFRVLSECGLFECFNV